MTTDLYDRIRSMTDDPIILAAVAESEAAEAGEPQTETLIDRATEAPDNWAHTISVERQYGVRYGDGEVDGPSNDRTAAREQMAAAREQIRDGSWEAADYEPMKIVTRIDMVATSPWVEVSA